MINLKCSVVALAFLALPMSFTPSAAVQQTDWCCIDFIYHVRSDCKGTCVAQPANCPQGTGIYEMTIVDAHCKYDPIHQCDLDVATWLQFYGTCSAGPCNPPETGKEACRFMWDGNPGTPISVFVCKTGTDHCDVQDPV